jgi:hypothetical protein
MNLVKHALALTVLALLFGCTSPQQNLGEWSQVNDATLSQIETTSYTLQAVTPNQLTVGNRLTVYIEGDGRAWATRSQPSLDPSPSKLDLIVLSMKSTYPGVYLARPCQFIMSDGCSTKIWTDQRFSRPVVDSYHHALDQLKETHRAKELELIGYSGGAAIAMLLAGERQDVVQIQTLAGNVDPFAWVHELNLSPLNGSLDPLQKAEVIAKIPQRHVVGSMDRTVPGKLAKQFVGKISARCAEVVELPHDHTTLVAGVTGSDLSKSIDCI